MHQDYNQLQVQQSETDTDEVLQIHENGDVYVDGNFVINDALLYQSLSDALNDDNFSLPDDEEMDSRIPQHQDEDTAEFYSATDGRCILKTNREGWFVEGKKTDNYLDVYLGLQTWLREIGTYPQLS